MRRDGSRGWHILPVQSICFSDRPVGCVWWSERVGVVVETRSLFLSEFQSPSTHRLLASPGSAAQTHDSGAIRSILVVQWLRTAAMTWVKSKQENAIRYHIFKLHCCISPLSRERSCSVAWNLWRRHCPSCLVHTVSFQFLPHSRSASSSPSSHVEV